jgi:hypothetical protein
MGIQSLFFKVTERRAFQPQSTVVSPPDLFEAFRFPYGPFRFKTQLPKGTVYVVLASTDLKNWTPIAKAIAGLDPIEYTDSEAFKFSCRFYRVIVGAVQSRNVVGYVAVTLPPGFSMIANPLEGTSRVAELFPEWPDGTSLSKYDTHRFELGDNAVKDGRWNKAETLSPGEGAIFFNPTQDYKSHSFVGELLQGNLSMPIPPGFSIRSSLVPQRGALAELLFPISEGDVIHLFDRERQKYVLYPYEQGKWTAGTPIISAGESFWVAKAKPGNWIRNLVIE